MSNVTWSSIIDTIKSIFDIKYIIHRFNPADFGAELDGDDKIKFWYSDIFRSVVIGVITQVDNGYQINLKSADPAEVTIPIGEYDQVEFVLINGRPTHPYIVFNNVMKMFLEY